MPFFSFLLIGFCPLNSLLKKFLNLKIILMSFLYLHKTKTFITLAKSDWGKCFGEMGKFL